MYSGRIFFGFEVQQTTTHTENGARLLREMSGGGTTVQARKWGVPNVVKILAKMEKNGEFLS